MTIFYVHTKYNGRIFHGKTTKIYKYLERTRLEDCDEILIYTSPQKDIEYTDVDSLPQMGDKLW